MKTRKTINKIICLLIFISSISQAQVGLGTENPDSSAALEVSSNTKGFLLPRMTENQLSNVVFPAEGLMIYCTDCTPKGLYIYNGTSFINAKGNTVTVTIPTVIGSGGAEWMDRNLGASQIATSSTDHLAYGYLYQWGRAADGHQVVNWISSTSTDGAEQARQTTTLSATNTPGHSDFIFGSSNWLTSIDNNLWQGVNGINNPCPSGFRVATQSEWQTEHNAWATNNAEGAFNSPLKLATTGARWYLDGQIFSAGATGYYWTSTEAMVFIFYSNSSNFGSFERAYGCPIRCIKD